MQIQRFYLRKRRIVLGDRIRFGDAIGAGDQMKILLEGAPIVVREVEREMSL